MNKSLLKGLVMTAIVVIASAIATAFPETLSQWEALGITLVGTLVGYFGQSYAFPSTSFLGDVNSRDFLKGLMVALANLLSSLGAAAATSTVIDWKDIAKSILIVFSGYIVKQLASPAPKM